MLLLRLSPTSWLAKPPQDSSMAIFMGLCMFLSITPHNWRIWYKFCVDFMNPTSLERGKIRKKIVGCIFIYFWFQWLWSMIQIVVRAKTVSGFCFEVKILLGLLSFDFFLNFILLFTIMLEFQHFLMLYFTHLFNDRFHML